MDLSKIFLKDACPTKMGGQAVMEGIMMKGEDKTALAVRMSDGSVKVETEMTKKPGKWTKIPIIRGAIRCLCSIHSRLIRSNIIIKCCFKLINGHLRPRFAS